MKVAIAGDLGRREFVIRNSSFAIRKSLVERAGADFLTLCTNTMHRVAPEIAARIRIPLLHIVDPTARALQMAGCRTVGLLGTRFTMEQDFYRGRLEASGLRVVVPPRADRDVVHRVIYEELCLGDIQDASRAEYRHIITELVAAGAGGVILGCTEIGLLINQANTKMPLYDTARIHAERALAWVLGD